MYRFTIDKQFFNYGLIILIILMIVPYLLFLPFLFTFLGIASLVNSLIFIGPYYMSILLYIGAIVVVTGALYSLTFINKKNWPLVEGTIIQSQVVRNPNSIFKLWTIKYTYTFTFEGINHIKNCYSKIIFTNRYDAHKYLEKISITDQNQLSVSVYKYYPGLSSINHKMNVFSLLYFYVVMVITSQLLFFGFLAKIYINYQLPPAENTDIFVQLQRIFSIYFAKFDVTLLILPAVILILLLIFILKSIWLIIHNKLYVFNSRIMPILETSTSQKDKLTQRMCVNCHQKNDLESTFCLNCGKMLEPLPTNANNTYYHQAIPLKAYYKNPPPPNPYYQEPGLGFTYPPNYTGRIPKPIGMTLILVYEIILSFLFVFIGIPLLLATNAQLPNLFGGLDPIFIHIAGGTAIMIGIVGILGAILFFQWKNKGYILNIIFLLVTGIMSIALTPIPAILTIVSIFYFYKGRNFKNTFNFVKNRKLQISNTSLEGI